MAEKTLVTMFGNRFIEPMECSSTVAWSIHVWSRDPEPEARHEHFRKGTVGIRATLRLSDCSRGIEWSLEGANPLGKIDAAIEELQSLRAGLVVAKGLQAEKLKLYGITEEEEE